MHMQLYVSNAEDWDEDMKFPGVLKKKSVEILGIIQKGSGISRGDKKIVWNFHRSWFLALKIPMGVIQFCGISWGEPSFCLEFLGVK